MDPTDIIETYGADTARWFMLSDSPPERDVIWTESGVEGAGRFVQRLWRIVNDAVEFGASPNTARPTEFDSEAVELRQAAHRALNAVDEDVERLRFNRCVAHIYEFSNTLATVLQNARQTPPSRDLAWAIREGVGILVQLVAPMMPHIAEESWAQIGGKGLVSEAAWPQVERELLVADTITYPVQINGKKRDELTVPIGASVAEIETEVRKLDSVLRAIDGKPIRKVIVVPQRIVNVVA